MPTLRCSLSKEIRGEAGGRTASVSLEVELAAETLKNPMLLKKHIKCGFDRVRAAIEEELARPDGATAGETSIEAPTRPARRDGNGADRPATPNQLRLLKMLADRGDADLSSLCRERFGKDDVESLGTREASRLIDQLNGTRTSKGRR